MAKWAFQKTWRQGEVAPTKKAATELLTAWKKEREAEGMTIMGSVARGHLMAYAKHPYYGRAVALAAAGEDPSSEGIQAATIRQLPKDFTPEVNES